MAAVVKYYDTGSDFDSELECVDDSNDGTPCDLYRVARTFDYDYHSLYNARKAFHYYTLAADKNHTDAQYVVGVYHRVGDEKLGIRIDYSRSLHYLLLAAYKRHQKAMYLISLAYRFGEGVGVDNIQAVHWQLLASSIKSHPTTNDHKNFGIGHKIKIAEEDASDIENEKCVELATKIFQIFQIFLQNPEL
jgi:TPR repeat protein